MKKLLAIAIPLCIALAGSPAPAQTDTPTRQSYSGDQGAEITPAAKQQSDGQMQLALGQLQAAASDLQSGNSSAAIGNIQTAVLHLKQALPIYHGHRDIAWHASDRAVIVLQRNRKEAVQRATELVSKAISEVQASLSVN
ncbi:MAG: hypothetical protein ACLQVD_05620 [Capsulimonadaceae bacterium]